MAAATQVCEQRSRSIPNVFTDACCEDRTTLKLVLLQIRYRILNHTISWPGVYSKYSQSLTVWPKYPVVLVVSLHIFQQVVKN